MQHGGAKCILLVKALHFINGEQIIRGGAADVRGPSNILISCLRLLVGRAIFNPGSLAARETRSE